MGSGHAVADTCFRCSIRSIAGNQASYPIPIVSGFPIRPNCEA